MIKAMPPLCPLLRLCLMMENITGPTDMLSNNPSVIPFSKASIIITKYEIRNTKYELRNTGNLFPDVCQHIRQIKKSVAFYSTSYLASRTSQRLPFDKNLFQSSSIFPFNTLGNLCWLPSFPFCAMNCINFSSGNTSIKTSFKALALSTA
jgi:hypothetical protein